MKYIRYGFGNGYCGCDGEEYIKYENNEFNEREQDEIAYEYATENAEMYEYVATQQFDEENYTTQEERDTALEELLNDYYDNLDYYWEEITEEEYKEETGDCDDEEDNYYVGTWSEDESEDES